MNSMAIDRLVYKPAPYPERLPFSVWFGLIFVVQLRFFDRRLHTRPADRSDQLFQEASEQKVQLKLK